MKKLTKEQVKKIIGEEDEKEEQTDNTELVKKYIPKQLRNPDFRFILIHKWDKKDKNNKSLGKSAFETGWEKESNYKFYEDKLINHIRSGGNFGIVGGFGNLLLVDGDSIEVDEKCKLLPETFTIKTGSKVEYKKHLYFICNEKFKMRFTKEKLGDLGDVRSEGQYVIAPNSTHPDGDKYRVIKDIPIANVSKAFIESIFKDIIDPLTNTETKTGDKKYPIDTTKRQSLFVKNCKVPDYVLNNKLKGNTSKNWKLFPYVIDVLNARDVSPDLYKRLAEKQEHQLGAVKGWVSKAKEGKLAKSSCKKMREYLNQYHPELIEDVCGGCPVYKKMKKDEEKKESMEGIEIFYNKRTLAEKFIETQPLFYDKNKLWWVWNFDSFAWEIIDETDILNAISKKHSANTINSKEKNEILEALKQVGRLNKPEDIKESWIQFKDKIYDIETGKEFTPTHKYFVTNPIKWKLGKSEETPELDKLFISWVGKEHKEELYEIIAFCIVPKYFIHRIICLIGSGANGKGTFLLVIKIFVGENNVVSSSLDTLISNRFASAKLYKKLVNLMGETNFSTISRTEFLKGATGEDTLPGEIKGGKLFDFVNYAKWILATNSLPMTLDKTEGFYRRWKIIDFPNKFMKEKEVLKNIPDQEYNNLALKCLNIAKGLWKNRILMNEGDFESRKERYEEKSNPVMLYLNQNYERDINGEVLFSEFFDGLKDFLIEREYRLLTAATISKQLKVEGFEIKNKNVERENGSKTTAKFIYGIKNNTQNTQNTQIPLQPPIRELSEDKGIMSNKGIIPNKSQRELEIVKIK